MKENRLWVEQSQNVCMQENQGRSFRWQRKSTLWPHMLFWTLRTIGETRLATVTLFPLLSFATELFRSALIVLALPSTAHQYFPCTSRATHTSFAQTAHDSRKINFCLLLNHRGKIQSTEKCLFSSFVFAHLHFEMSSACWLWSLEYYCHRPMQSCYTILPWSLLQLWPGTYFLVERDPFPALMKQDCDLYPILRFPSWLDLYASLV